MTKDPDSNQIGLRRYEGSRFTFCVLGRSHVSHVVPDEPYIVISITDSKSKEADVAESPNRVGLLRLRFDDTGDLGLRRRDDVAMSREHAQAILSFVRANEDLASTIICQCEAGVSRSAGVAAALSRILQGDSRFFYANFEPNTWVYQTIIEEHQKERLRIEEKRPQSGGTIRAATRVKICGITKLEDALFAIECGADALGFIGVRESPRFVNPAQFEAIAAKLPPFLRTVIVVNRPEDAREYTADLIQHYAEPLDSSETARDPHRLIRAFRIKDESSLEELRSYTNPVRAVMLDAYAPDKLGGTGRRLSWKLAERAKNVTRHPILLAGGLTDENVAHAVAAVHPYAVDVASGVESAPGIKDHDKVRAFIEAVRKFDLTGELD